MFCLINFFYNYPIIVKKLEKSRLFYWVFLMLEKIFQNLQIRSLLKEREKSRISSLSKSYMSCMNQKILL